MHVHDDHTARRILCGEVGEETPPGPGKNESVRQGRYEPWRRAERDEYGGGRPGKRGGAG